MNNMKNQLSRRTFLKAGLAGALGLAVGCENNQNITRKEQEVSRRNIERSAEYMTEQIRQITTYGNFSNRSGLDYDTFSSVLGIDKELQTMDKKSVWIEVTTRPYGIKQSVTHDGFVRIDIPYNNSQEVLSKLITYQNKALGIKPLTTKDFEGLPAGGY